MLKINNDKKQIQIPDCWEDLSQSEFVKTCELLGLLLSGQISIDVFRLMLLRKLTGYKRSKHFTLSAEEKENIDANLTILSNMLTFPTKPHYDRPELLETLSPDLQQFLKKAFPDEIENTEQIEELYNMREKPKCRPVVDFKIKRNILGNIKARNTELQGVYFDIHGYDITTDLTAEEFVDANDFLQQFEKTKEEKYLNEFCSVLYRNNRPDYDTTKVRQAAVQFKYVRTHYKTAIMFLFQNIIEFFATHPAFSIFFKKKEGENDGTISLGLADSIYNMSIDGYGSRQEVGQMNVTDYFNIMLKKLKDTVAQLRASKMDELKICQALNIDSDVLNRL